MLLFFYWRKILNSEFLLVMEYFWNCAIAWFTEVQDYCLLEFNSHSFIFDMKERSKAEHKNIFHYLLESSENVPFVKQRTNNILKKTAGFCDWLTKWNQLEPWTHTHSHTYTSHAHNIVIVIIHQWFSNCGVGPAGGSWSHCRGM